MDSIIEITKDINTDKLLKEGLQYVGNHLAKRLSETYDEKTLNELDMNLYYQEGFHGFDVIDDETGAFLVRFKDGREAVLLALRSNGKMISFYAFPNDHQIGREIVRFYRSGHNGSPFKRRRDFYRFRDCLKQLPQTEPIGSFI